MGILEDLQEKQAKEKGEKSKDIMWVHSLIKIHPDGTVEILKSYNTIPSVQAAKRNVKAKQPKIEINKDASSESLF